MALTSPYQNNTATPAQNSIVGFKLSKPGYNAVSTAGNNLLFSSSWPSLPIAFETSVTSGFPVSVTHNLKFPPFAMVWAYNPSFGGIAASTQRFVFPVDATKLYLDTTGFSNQQLAFWNGATKAKIRCFQLDLSIDIDYTLAPGDSFNMPYDNSFGIKVVKPNNDINSRDMRDFALHSRCQSPLILAVKTQKTMPGANAGTAIGNVVQYQSLQKYPVWVYGFVRQSSGKYKPAPYYSQSYPKTTTDGFLSYISYGPSGNTDTGATLVILRDPMFAATVTTVQY